MAVSAKIAMIRRRGEAVVCCCRVDAEEEWVDCIEASADAEVAAEVWERAVESRRERP